MRSKITILPVVLAGLISAIISASGCSRYLAPKEYKESQASAYTELNETKIPGEPAEISIRDTEPADKDFPVREEIRRSYPVNPGATIYLGRINGGVKVETADIDRAEMLLVRLAKNKDDLQYQQIAVEQSAENLSIYTESDRHSVFSSLATGAPEVRQRVIMRVPVKIVLEASRISGDLVAGKIDGRLELTNIKGSVRVERAFGQSELSGISGETDITFAPLNGRGLEIRGISGNVTLKFEGEINAELRVRGVAGEINNKLDQVAPEGEQGRSGWKTTQIGTGGPEIQLQRISGNVTLMKAAKSEGFRKKGQD